MGKQIYLSDKEIEILNKVIDISANYVEGEEAETLDKTKNKINS